MTEKEFMFILIGILISILLLLIFTPYRRKISNGINECLNEENNKMKNENIKLENQINFHYLVLADLYQKDSKTMTKSNAEKFIKKLESIREKHPELKEFFDKINK